MVLAKKAQKDFFKIDGQKYVTNQRVKETTSLVDDSQALVQMKYSSKNISSAVIFDLAAAEDFTTYKKGTQINVINELAEEDFDEEDFDFKDEAVLVFSHNFLEGNEAVAYDNDESSIVTGTMKLQKFNKKKGIAVMTFKLQIENALVTTTDINLNQTFSRLNEIINVSGKFTTVLY